MKMSTFFGIFYLVLTWKCLFSKMSYLFISFVSVFPNTLDKMLEVCTTLKMQLIMIHGEHGGRPQWNHPTQNIITSTTWV